MSCDLPVPMQNFPLTLKFFLLAINLIFKPDFLFLPFLGQGPLLTGVQAWFGTHYATQTGLKLWRSSCLSYPVLGLQV